MRFTSPSRGFFLLFVLAYAGLFVSFVPFASVLLPLKIATVSPPSERLWLLSAATLGGACVASIVNLVFGALSDRSYRLHGTRRGWIAGGLCLLLLGYGLFHRSTDAGSLLCAVAMLQVAINMMFAPLTAMMADEVQDGQKGRVAGLMAMAHPFASLVAAAVMLGQLGTPGMRLALLCLAVLILTTPLVALIRERRQDATAPPPALCVRRRTDLAGLWTARILVQIAGNGISAYALFYFLSMPGMRASNGAELESAGASIALVFAGVTIAAVLVTLLAGVTSDRLMRRKPFIAGGAMAMALGLGVMAVAHDLSVAALGFGAATCGMSVFLAMQSALAMQLLPSPQHRGRDLGIFNLTNTLPSMVAPLLALVLDPEAAGYGPWLAVLAATVLVGALIALFVRSAR